MDIRSKIVTLILKVTFILFEIKIKSNKVNKK